VRGNKLTAFRHLISWEGLAPRVDVAAVGPASIVATRRFQHWQSLYDCSRPHSRTRQKCSAAAELAAAIAEVMPRVAPETQLGLLAARLAAEAVLAIAARVSEQPSVPHHYFAPGQR
jgi:hypothetical protein